MDKVLTVIVPSYNAEKYLQEDIPFFLNKDILDDVEILIVNDGSIDRTQEIAEMFQEKYPSSIRVIKKKNGGHGSAINVGIRKAKGKYLKVVDADDWVDTDSFSRLVDMLKVVESDLILNPFYYVNVVTGEKEVGLPIASEMWAQIKYGHPYEVVNMLAQIEDTLQMHSVTYRTSLLKKHQIRIDENHFYVDQEYVLYPIPFVRFVVFYPEFVYQYRIATNEQSMSWKNMIKNREMHGEVLISMIQYYEKVKEKLTKEQKHFFEYRCAKMLNTQAGIYLMMDNGKIAKQEMREFEEKISIQYPDIYKFPYSRKMILLRRMGYLGFSLIAMYTKKVNGS